MNGGCDNLGMFDHINYEMNCPICGTRLKDFQSKDGDCSLKVIEFSEVKHFYDHCLNCETLVEFDRKSKRDKKYTIDDYELTVKTLEEREKEWEARKKEIKENECSYCEGTGKRVVDVKYKNVEQHMKKYELKFEQMMAQILKQEIYCDSGELTHLINDEKMEDFIKSLEIENGVDLGE